MTLMCREEGRGWGGRLVRGDRPQLIRACASVQVLPSCLLPRRRSTSSVRSRCTRRWSRFTRWCAPGSRRTLGEPTEPQVRGWPLIRERPGRAHRRAHRLGQDAHRLPRLPRPALPPRRRGHAAGRDRGALRVAAQGARQRRAEEPVRAARAAARARQARRPRAARGARAGAHRRHQRLRARADGEAAAAHSHHHARVALPVPHRRDAPADAQVGAHGGGGRDPRARPRQARLALRALDGAAQGAVRRSRSWSGLSATQKPLELLARFLTGNRSRPCEVVQVGHLRPWELSLETPEDELGSVATHEMWGQVYDRLVALAEAHRTMLVFTNTRRLAERIAHDLGEPHRRRQGDGAPRQHGARAAAEGGGAAQGRRS